jgi:long-chain fatty acid transport protein
MKNYFLTICLLFASVTVFAQAGHIMQGVGAVNMSMGGAATGQPLDINGAMQWNPAALSEFDGKIVSFNIGAFFSSPELSSSLPENAMWVGSPAVSGMTEDDRGTSAMPSLAFMWGKEDSKHTFGASMFGISGFGVTFPEEANNPLSPDFNPTVDSNPINYPQAANGFGNIESDYMLLQIGLTWAYQLTDKISVGVEPTFNYASLELAPNPVAMPQFPVELGGTGQGYPVADKATAAGFGAQFGVFYNSGSGFKAGVSYKTKQYFSDFDFDQKYLVPDQTPGSVNTDLSAPNVKFNMNYPSIISVGLGYSLKDFDLALDYRYVDYENTEGFQESGWQIATSGPAAGFPTGAVNGFGWNSMSIVSAGVQYKGIDKLPIRIGYTYSTNPIDDELAFFSIPATAVIENAMQLGFSYILNDKIDLSAVYHYGFRGDGASGELLNPMMITPDNPLGAVPGTSVSYDMSTSMIQFGINYSFGKSSTDAAQPAE